MKRAVSSICVVCTGLWRDWHGWIPHAPSPCAQLSFQVWQLLSARMIPIRSNVKMNRGEELLSLCSTLIITVLLLSGGALLCRSIFWWVFKLQWKKITIHTFMMALSWGGDDATSTPRLSTNYWIVYRWLQITGVMLLQWNLQYSDGTEILKMILFQGKKKKLVHLSEKNDEIQNRLILYDLTSNQIYS